MSDLQFYPTPSNLAVKAISKFKHKIVRLLEPSAGRGDLVEPLLGPYRRDGNLLPSVDCVELDFTNQSTLKGKGLRVVGHDFLAYESATMYSHILMNPPFAEGVEHVLHAWKILFHGEIVAILNAETVRDPCTKARQLLVKLIEDHGSVEFLKDQFVTPETQRKTSVEVALVYLSKDSGFQVNFIEKLKATKIKDELNLRSSENEILVPANTIENWITNYELAAESLKQAAMHNSRAGLYVGRFDRSIIDNTTTKCDPVAETIKWFNEKHDKLKECAWSTVLRSSKITDRLSSGMQESVESQFETIRNLDFSMQNIYGFLEGIIEQQSALQIGMICEVFDIISKFHDKNRLWYCGWKSNTFHRVNAFRVMHTRFILPTCDSSYCSSFSWKDTKRFSDFDKIFSLLDGRHVDTVYGLAQMTKENASELRRGIRCSSDYFDLRYYPGAGTFHFYPRRRDLIDRLNRMVGKYRQWIPMDDAPEETEFWEQYDKAEAINTRMNLNGLNEWRIYNGSDFEKESAGKLLRDEFEKAIGLMGLKYNLDSALPPSDGPAALPKLEDAVSCSVSISPMGSSVDAGW